MPFPCPTLNETISSTVQHHKNKNCPNCRKKIENIDHIIQILEEQKENTNQSLIENFDDYYFPTHGLCRMSIVYCKNCIIVTGVMSFIGFSSFFLGSLFIKNDNKDILTDDYQDEDKLSITDIYAIQVAFGFIIFCFIFNVLRCCYKNCFTEPLRN